jgi:AcrR family transcriptional regulator
MSTLRADVTAKPVSKPRPGGRAAEVSDRVFRATLDLLAKGGLAAVTFQEVALVAAVGRATLYRRWPDTAALVADAVSATAAEEILIADTGTLRGDIVAILLQISKFISSPTGKATLVAALSLPRGGVEGAALQRWHKRWSDIAPIFDRARARGEIADEANCEALFAALAGSLYFRLIVMHAEIDDVWISAVVDQIFYGDRGRHCGAECIVEPQAAKP